MGSGTSLMSCEIKTGSRTDAPSHCLGERESSKSPMTGAACPRAERKPKARRRLSLCMTVVCNTGVVRCFTMDMDRAQGARR